MGDIFAICRSIEVQDDEVRSFVLARNTESGNAAWPILIARQGGRLFGYENACPHSGSRLDTVRGQFLDEEGNFITCGKHGAKFDFDSGHCFIGPCKGQALTAIPLIIDDGDICITGFELAEEDGLDLAEPDEHPEVMISSD